MSNKIISFASQKGGVGKTTSTINFATALAATGKSVLIIDIDPQGNASTGLGIKQEQRINTIYQVMAGDLGIKDAALQTVVPNLHIVPSDINLAAAELELHSVENKELFLLNLLFNITDWEFIIIDCPPSLGMLTINALCASDSVIIPVQSEFFALEGLAHLIRTIQLIQKNYNPKLAVEGILMTMMDKRSKLSIAVENEVRSVFGAKVFQTVIPRNVKLSEASSHGKPALIYDFKCVGSISYAMLVREFLYKQHLKNQQGQNE